MSLSIDSLTEVLLQSGMTIELNEQSLRAGHFTDDTSIMRSRRAVDETYNFSENYTIHALRMSVCRNSVSSIHAEGGRSIGSSVCPT